MIGWFLRNCYQRAISGSGETRESESEKGWNGEKETEWHCLRSKLSDRDSEWERGKEEWTREYRKGYFIKQHTICYQTSSILDPVILGLSEYIQNRKNCVKSIYYVYKKSKTFDSIDLDRSDKWGVFLLNGLFGESNGMDFNASLYHNTSHSLQSHTMFEITKMTSIYCNLQSIHWQIPYTFRFYSSYLFITVVQVTRLHDFIMFFNGYRLWPLWECFPHTNQRTNRTIMDGIKISLTQVIILQTAFPCRGHSHFMFYFICCSLFVLGNTWIERMKLQHGYRIQIE